MKVTLTDVGNDVLKIEGLDDAGNVVAEALGWVSATSNHYEADAYFTEADGSDEDGRPLVGHFKPDVKPRAMTDAEMQEYATRLLLEQNEQLHEPKELLVFEDATIAVSAASAQGVSVAPAA